MLARDADGAEQWLTDAWGRLVPGPAPVPYRDYEPAFDGAAAACDMAMLLLSRRRSADAATWARRAVDRAFTSVPRACAQVVLATCQALAGQPDQALAQLRAELGAIAGDGDPAGKLLRLGIGTVLLWCDDLRGAAAYLGTAASTGGSRGLPLSHLLEASVLRVTADYRMGEWDAAAAGAARLVALVDDLDQSWLLASAHCCAVYPHAGRGEWELASAHVDAAARLVRAGSSDRVLELVNAQAALAFARDDPAGVIAAVAPVAGHLTVLAQVEPTMLGFWPLYADALARTGRVAEAADALGPFAELAAARGRLSALAAAHRVRGWLEAARQQPEAAHAAYLSAISCLDGLGMPHEEAVTRLDYGRFLRHAGQRRAALRELCAARATFAGMGAAPFVARCDAELGHDVPAGQLLPLTARQLAVARAVAAGKSNQQVARDLYITVKTVEYHVSQILTRLSIDTRTEIAAALPAVHSR
jgi:DNA-binding CsgD family transcriptional regulator